MERNTVIGFVLIGIILIVFTVLNQPSKEDLAIQQHIQDSIRVTQMIHQKEDSIRNATQIDLTKNDSVKSTATIDTTLALFQDSINQTEKFSVLENDLMKVTFTNKGGRVFSVMLKKFKDYNGKQLVLFNDADATFGYQFFSNGQQPVNTSDIYFTPENTIQDSAAKLVYTAKAGNTSQLKQVYSLPANSYLLKYSFQTSGLNEVVGNNTQYINLNWEIKQPHVEQNLANERTTSSVYYAFKQDNEVSSISEHSDGDEKLQGDLKWVSFKQHFFNSTLISDSVFLSGCSVKTKTVDDSAHVKDISAQLVLPYDHSGNNQYNMQFYFGPNSYTDLKKLGYGLEQVIPLGWGIFGFIASPINKYFIIPLFNFLNNYIGNYGIIILIMTLLIRIIILPMTYRSFLSSAKMRVLKPELDELKLKLKDDQTRFAQEQMKLYKRAGVSPLGGCIPALLQLPILVSMYSFFPISIELRQQPFLWATDLSSYDSIWNFGTNIWPLGDHLSLFTILMTVTSLLTAWYSSQFNATNNQFKWLQYIFPFMLLGIFNSLSAALTYYYFLSNVLTLVQQFIIQEFIIDHDAIHRKIEENKKKPIKKSSWQQRLEDMSKAQQERGRKK